MKPAEGPGAAPAFVCPECGERSTVPGACRNDGHSLAATDDPLLGTEVARYRLARLLGRGGMGRVYLGVQPAIGSRVAIKILAEDLIGDRDQLERFFAEARAVNVIRHENIVNVLDLDRLPNGRPYIVMEYIAGATLRDIVERGPAPIGGAVQAVIEVLLALEAAHAAGIVHRDLKPDNVMITEGGHAKVVDFGIAKLSIKPGPRTVSGVAIGTPHYMAPEQITGGTIDARTDVYAMGCVLYEVLTGRRPFDGTTDYQLMHAHVSEEPHPLHALRAEIPDELAQIVGQAMTKRAEERFASAKAMARALRHVLAALPPEQRRSLSPAAWLPPPAAASLELPRQRGDDVPTRGDRADGAATRPDSPRAGIEASTPTRVDRPSRRGSNEHDGAKPALGGEARGGERAAGNARAAGDAPAADGNARAATRRRGWVAGMAVAGTAIAGLAVFAAVGSRDAPAPTERSGPDVLATVPPATDAAAPLPSSIVALDAAPAAIPALDGSVTPPTAPRPSGRGPREPADRRAKPSDTGSADRPKEPGGAGPGGLMAEPAEQGSGAYEERTATKLAKRPDYDPKSFDATGYVAKADALARELSPQAALQSIVVWEVGDGGRSDFTIALRRGFASYTYRSATAPCNVHVTATKDRVTALVSSGSCGNGSHLPRCTLAQVYARAQAAGYVFEHERVDIEWTGAHWRILARNAGVEKLDDDCTKPLPAFRPRPAPPTVVEKPPSPDRIPREKRTIERPFPDRTGFDPRTYAPTALRLARELEADAELIVLEVTGITADGTINGTPKYTFRSEKAIASGDPDRLDCIEVSVQLSGKPIVRARWSPSAGCARARTISVPRCSPAALIAKIDAAARPDTTRIRWDHGGWSLWGAGLRRTDIADDCR